MGFNLAFEGLEYNIKIKLYMYSELSRYSEWIRAGRSGDRIPVGARLSAPLQTGCVAHPASCTMGTGSLPGVESGPGVTLTPHPLLVPKCKNRVELYPYSRQGTSWPVKSVKPTYICTPSDTAMFLYYYFKCWQSQSIIKWTTVRRHE
jgi:hypothetical protein